MRAGAYALYGRNAVSPVSGTDEVYGVNLARFLADNGQADELVLSLYGQLGAAMTPGTFVAGEAASIAPLPGLSARAMYLPPNSAANASFLETLRLTLVHEVDGPAGTPERLELGYATPRAWLLPGRTIRVRDLPTGFGTVSFTLTAQRHQVRARLELPARTPALLRLRLPNGERIVAVHVGSRAETAFDPSTGTVDLRGLGDHPDLTITLR